MYETLYIFCAHVIWIAFGKPDYSIFTNELYRILQSIQLVSKLTLGLCRLLNQPRFSRVRVRFFPFLPAIACMRQWKCKSETIGAKIRKVCIKILVMFDFIKEFKPYYKQCVLIMTFWAQYLVDNHNVWKCQMCNFDAMKMESHLK